MCIRTWSIKYFATLKIEIKKICDAIKQNESEVKKYDFWFSGIFC